MNEKPEKPDWLTKMDEQILEVLGSQLILTPSIIAENIGRSRKGVSNRINSLQAGELVRKVDRGKYQITDEGLTILEVLDSSNSRSLRLDVAQDKLMQHELGVSLEEYQNAVQREHEKIRENEGISDFDEALDMAFERVEQRLEEEKEDKSSH